MQQVTIAIFGQFQIRLTGLFALFLKTMEDINYIGEFCEVNDPKCSVQIFETDFSDTLPYGFHRTPVTRLPPVLDLVKLESRLTLDVLWEGAKIVQRTSSEFELSDGCHTRIIQTFVYQHKYRAPCVFVASDASERTVELRHLGTRVAPKRATASVTIDGHRHWRSHRAFTGLPVLAGWPKLLDPVCQQPNTKVPR